MLIDCGVSCTALSVRVALAGALNERLLALLPPALAA